MARSWIIWWSAVPAGPPLGGLYLKPPSSGGLWEGVMTTPSASPVCWPWIVGEDGVGDDGRGRVAQPGLDDDVGFIGGKNFNGRCQRRFRQRMGIHADVQRAGNAFPPAAARQSPGKSPGYGSR